MPDNDERRPGQGGVTVEQNDPQTVPLPYDETAAPRRVDRFAWERSLRAADSGVKSTALLVLLVLGSFMNAEGGGGRPGHDLLAEAAGVDVRTVRRHLAAAVRDGWLRLDQRGGRRGDGSPFASTYSATCPPDSRVQRTAESTGQRTRVHRTEIACPPDTPVHPPRVTTLLPPPPAREDAPDPSVVVAAENVIDAIPPSIGERLSPPTVHALVVAAFGRGIGAGQLLAAARRPWPHDVTSPLAVLRARFDELQPPRATQARPECPSCDHGWIGETAAGERIPCLRCKPHLAKRRVA